MVNSFLKQGGAYDNVAFGVLLEKSLVESVNFIEYMLPLDIFVRNLAGYNVF